MILPYFFNSKVLATTAAVFKWISQYYCIWYCNTLTAVKSLKPRAVNQNLHSYLCPPSHLLCIDLQTIERSHRYRALYVCAFLWGFISIRSSVLELCPITAPIQVCLTRHPQESNILMIFTRGNCILNVNCFPESLHYLLHYSSEFSNCYFISLLSPN